MGGIGLAAALALAPDSASALVPAGSVVSDFTVNDVDDRAVSLATFRGKPTLVVYEDKDAGEQNAGFKTKLGALARGTDLAKKIGLFAIADVKSWNFWPARGFVKDELRAQMKKIGVPIYADWEGRGRDRLAAKSSVSNIVFLDRKGQVLWASTGALDAAQADRLIALIKANIDP
jgi:hypothetical protein